VVGGTDHAVEPGLVQSELLEEGLAVGGVELGDLGLDGRAHRYDVGAFLVGALLHRIEERVVLEAVLRDVRHVHERLERDQVQLPQQRPRSAGSISSVRNGPAGVEVLTDALQQVAQADGVLVPALEAFSARCRPRSNGLEVGRARARC